MHVSRCCKGFIYDGRMDERIWQAPGGTVLVRVLYGPTLGLWCLPVHTLHSVAELLCGTVPHVGR